VPVTALLDEDVLRNIRIFDEKVIRVWRQANGLWCNSIAMTWHNSLEEVLSFIKPYSVGKGICMNEHTSLAEEWMPYKSGTSLLRLPTLEECELTLEVLGKLGAVHRTRKTSTFTKGTLKDYRRLETNENIITHVQEKETGEVIYFLKSYGLESWIVRIVK
jgi:hypothetical protein